jgi:malonyl CoA-acyl carrier protein transacylase
MQQITDSHNPSPKTAWLFPGQGSQAIGMGADLLDISDAKDKFTQAEDILGWSVAEICQSEDKLSRTLYTQPSLYVVESILGGLDARSWISAQFSSWSQSRRIYRPLCRWSF